MKLKQCKLLICGVVSLASLMFSTAYAEQSTVEQEFFILEGETQLLSDFFDEAHFESCKSIKTTAYLHYQLGEMTLSSAQKIDGQCAVLFQHETELGDVVETLCDMENFQKTEFLYTEDKELRLSPPYCHTEERATSNVIKDVDIDNASVNDGVVIADADSDTDVDDEPEKSNDFFKGLFSFFLNIFLGSLNA